MDSKVTRFIMLEVNPSPFIVSKVFTTVVLVGCAGGLFIGEVFAG